MSKIKKTIEEELEETLIPEEEHPYYVPENWVWITLKEVCRINMGQSPKGEYTSDNQSYTPLIGGPADMGTNYPKPIRFTSKPTKLSEVGELIVSVRATLGKTNLSDGEYCLGRGVAGINSSYLDIGLLRHYFDTLDSYLHSVSTGTTFKQVTKKGVENIPFPLSPIYEQKRISDKVERLINKIDDAKQLIGEAKKSFELSRAAILNKTFRGELTKEWRGDNNLDNLENNFTSAINNSPYAIPISWKWTTLEEVCEKITDGTHHSPKSYPTGDYKYITAKNIKEKGIQLNNITYISEEVHKGIYNRCDVKKNDVLYIKDGATTGIATINTLSEEFSLLSSVGLLRPKKEVLLPEYLTFYLNSPEGKEKMLSNMSGNAIRRLTIKKIKQGIIPLPPIEEQNKIISVLGKIKQLDKKLNISVDLNEILSTIKQSILSKAFRGELGTNDPTEESAIELLKEVLQEK